MEPSNVQPVQSGAPVEDWTKYDPKYRAAADYLGIDVNNEWPRQKRKLDYILDWATKESGSEKTIDILGKIYELDKKFGYPSWDDRKINHIYRHLKIGRLKETRSTNGEIPRKPVRVQKSTLPKGVSREVNTLFTRSVKDVLKQVFTQIGSWKDRIK